jgi:predicted NUDIX family phosphoesterase
MNGGERVLGLARDDVPGGTDWRGVVDRPLAPYLEALKAYGEFRSRAEAEQDPSWKQVIPYVMLRDGEQIFLMRRTRAGGDERLHDRYSIGIGGHVNPQDGDLGGGLLREWTEEIDADFIPDFQPLGVLNDDGNAVGAVHLGLVFVAQAEGRPVAIRETEKLEGRFVSVGEVTAVRDRLETWSSLLLDFMMETETGG